MIPDNAQIGVTRLAQDGDLRSARYRYSAGESLTDAAETAQDPGKPVREREAIVRAVPRRARVLCDYGCGVGRNFPVLARACPASSLCIGVEPDAARLRRAAQTSDGFSVLHGGVERLDAFFARCAFVIDHLLCCQVIGHTTRAETRRIVSSVVRWLSPSGTAHFCVPFVNAALHRGGGGDFYHVVDLERAPHMAGFRTALDAQAFDALVSTGASAGRLPVRAFALDLGVGRNAHRVPFGVRASPGALVPPAGSGLRASASVYAVHVWAGERAYIGDVSVRWWRAFD